MDLFGWIQLALYVLILLFLTKPVGLYLVRVLDAEGKTFLDPVLKPVEKLLYRLFGFGSEKGAGLEAVHHLHACFQPGRVVVHLCHPPAPAPPSIEPTGIWAGQPGPRLQHGRQLHNQHQLAELRRRVDSVLFLTDGGPCLP